ncbi:MAG: ankyrin repeat domain-containing protein, partial [Verrucomicrobiota bacterium]
RWLHPVMGVKFAPAVVPADREEEEASPQPRRRWAKVAEILTVFVATQLIVLAQMGTVIAITASQFGRGEGGSLASDSIWEAAKENKIETLQSMLEEESRVNRKDPKFQLTALHWAAINGQSEAAALLLEAGAKVNARSGDQSTPLSQAAFMGNVETVALLLKHGAEVNPVNHHKTTPLDVTFADWSTVTWVTEMLDLNADREEWEKGRLEVRKLLIEHGGKHRSQLSG